MVVTSEHVLGGQQGTPRDASAANGPSSPLQPAKNNNKHKSMVQLRGVRLKFEGSGFDPRPSYAADLNLGFLVAVLPNA